MKYPHNSSCSMFLENYAIKISPISKQICSQAYVYFAVIMINTMYVSGYNDLSINISKYWNYQLFLMESEISTK